MNEQSSRKDGDSNGPPKAIDEPETESVTPGRCGLGRCTPEWLQVFNNVKGLLAAVCFFFFVEGFVVSGIFSVNITSFERRFDLTTTQMAWASCAYDLSAGFMAVLFGYLGTFAHKGHLLGISAIFMSIGCFIMALPHPLGGKYELGAKIPEECAIEGNATLCSDMSQPSSTAQSLLMFGMMLVGVGGSALFLLSPTWLDDNVDEVDMPLYFGIVYTFASLGPATAYIVGAIFLDIYVDVDKSTISDSIDITPSDPRWVGAWWIGYLLVGCVSIFVAILISCFPKIIPGRKPKRTNQAHRGYGEELVARVDFGRSFKDIKVSLKIVFSNVPWVLTTLTAILGMALVVAFIVFMPKVFQFQFSMTASDASFVSGSVVVPAGAIGYLLGGFIPKWCKFKVRGLFWQCCVTALIGALLSPIFLMRCDMPQLAGVTVGYMNSTLANGAVSINADCNANCSCSSASYEPVCGPGSVEYFSPCHAGCMESETSSDGEKLFKSCSCITGYISVNLTDDHWQARDGICTTDCEQFTYFLIGFFILALVVSVGGTSGNAVVIRCVPDKSKSFAFGVSHYIVRVFGAVPGPIILGILFDKSCLVWKSDCAQKGSCWVYDNESFSWTLFWVVLAVNVICALLFLLAALVYKPPDSEGSVIAMELEITAGNENQGSSTS